MRWLGNRQMHAPAGLAAALVLVVGCSKTKVETLTVAPATGSVTIHLDHTVNGVGLVLNSTQYAGMDGAGNVYSVDELRYIISNVRLHKNDGAVYGFDDFHYRDAAVPGTRDYLLPGIPPGTYTALSFTFGLDDRMNVSGPPVSNVPGIAGMEWPPNWGGGWHYMILEGLYDPVNGFGYRTHLGRRFIASAGDPSGQGPDSVQYHHHFTVHLVFGTPITIDGDNWQAAVNMEINGWYEDPAFDLSYYFPNGTGGIMVDLVAEGLLQQNGPGCFSISQPARM